MVPARELCFTGVGCMPEFSRVVIAGREYFVLQLTVKPKKVRSKGREYVQHYINLPKWFSRKLYELAGEDPETELPIVFIAAPAEWYHGILWDEMPERAWKTIPDRVKQELEALGLSREPKEIVFIAATENEIKELGLNPSDIITLKKLKRKIIEEAMRKTAPITP